MIKHRLKWNRKNKWIIMPEEVWTKIPAKLENQWNQFGPIYSIKQVQTEMVRYGNIKPQN